MGNNDDNNNPIDHRFFSSFSLSHTRSIFPAQSPSSDLQNLPDSFSFALFPFLSILKQASSRVFLPLAFLNLASSLNSYQVCSFCIICRDNIIFGRFTVYVSLRSLPLNNPESDHRPLEVSGLGCTELNF
ncbi:unnamed protein product [Citrullus colocynthis]|uniref:Uncharacterized protein n=1 Tax=Citrullus colocynthis TaxID=252529 RepID=A0ABP0XV46_9ROSI